MTSMELLLSETNMLRMLLNINIIYNKLLQHGKSMH